MKHKNSNDEAIKEFGNLRKIKAIRERTGLTQAAFAEKYNIPRRTVENWEAGKNSPPDYVVELLSFRIEHE